MGAGSRPWFGLLFVLRISQARSPVRPGAPWVPFCCRVPLSGTKCNDNISGPEIEGSYRASLRAFDVGSRDALTLFSRLRSWKTVRSESNEMIVKLVRPGIG